MFVAFLTFPSLYLVSKGIHYKSSESLHYEERLRWVLYIRHLWRIACIRLKDGPSTQNISVPLSCERTSISLIGFNGE